MLVWETTLVEEAIWHSRRLLSYENDGDNSLIVLSHCGSSNFGPSLPGVVIIISSLYKKKRMASFSKAYGDNLSTLHRWHMLSSPNFSKVFDEYRVTNTTWYNTTPWILQCRSNLYVFFLILIKSKNLSPFLAMVLIWLKRWWFKVGQGCAIRQFPPRQNLSFTVLFDIKWLVIRTNLQLPYLHRRLFS